MGIKNLTDVNESGSVHDDAMILLTQKETGSIEVLRRVAVSTLAGALQAGNRSVYITVSNGTATINTDVCKELGLNYDDLAKAFAPLCTKVQSIVTAESFDDLNK